MSNVARAAAAIPSFEADSHEAVGLLPAHFIPSKIGDDRDFGVLGWTPSLLNNDFRGGLHDNHRLLLVADHGWRLVMDIRVVHQHRRVGS